jgi:enolase
VSSTAITGIFAWEALDSRGNPTVACEVSLRSGARGAVIVPSGASTGAHEAVELRDGGMRYGGRGVRAAVANATGELAERVTGMDAADQVALDAALKETDGTPGLRRLGANAVLAVSLAAACAVADAAGVPLYRRLLAGDSPLLPMPMVNVLSGGAHARGGVELQDFLAVPLGAGSFAEAMEWVWRVRRAAEELVAARGLTTLIADEGGLGPPLPSSRAALELLSEAIASSGLRPVKDVAIALDVAASQLVTAEGPYGLGGEELTGAELTAEVERWCGSHPIVSIEDPLAEDDWAGWAEATALLGDRVQLVGDDLFATDVERLERGIRERVANAVLVKPNQAGTLSGAEAVVRRAAEAGYRAIVSARSGDTEDAWLADLAVGWRAGQIKVGSLTRSERTAKWNRLLRIEAELGGEAELARPFDPRSGMLGKVVGEKDRRRQERSTKPKAGGEGA